MREKGEDSFSIVSIEDTTGNFLMMCFFEEGEKWGSLLERRRRAAVPRILQSIGNRLESTSSDSVDTVSKVLVIMRAAVRWTDLSDFRFDFRLSADDQTAQPFVRMGSTVEEYKNRKRFRSQPQACRIQL